MAAFGILIVPGELSRFILLLAGVVAVAVCDAPGELIDLRAFVGSDVHMC